MAPPLGNGKPVRRHALRPEDEIALGEGRPEVAFGIDGDPAQPTAERHGEEPLCPDEFQPRAAAGPQDAHALAREVQQKIATVRAAARPSAPAQRLASIDAEEPPRASSRRRRLAPLVVAASLLALALAAVAWHHHQRVAEILEKKAALDQQIGRIGRAMEAERDAGKLASLEDQLTDLTGQAEARLRELGRVDESEAARAERSGDDLDRDLRGILERLNARAYAVPAVFEERVRQEIQAMLRRPGVSEALARKQKYWPLVVKELSAFGLPAELGYVAWTASRFDPAAQAASGGRGMWQFTEARARDLGLRVDGRVDERTDAVKETRAAARQLASLLSEFGDDSFLLAIAGYGSGEPAIRRVLHEVAQEPGGFRKDKRGFWRLYRLKRLPAEALDPLHRFFAAALIGNDPGRYGPGHEP
ncbi:MAG TPA: transglycosylase SLT domain-containing protein [Myxococcales bacterium]|nr:transglycosylase SLT domain-containing protein [Myxococcales bacterium]